MSKKDIVSQLVDKYRDDIVKINDTVWEYAEPGMKEYKTAAFMKTFSKKRASM